MTLFVFIYAYYQSVRILPFLVRAVQVDGLFLLQHSACKCQIAARSGQKTNGATEPVFIYSGLVPVHYVVGFGNCTCS